jgi:hypothetical protein
MVQDQPFFGESHKNPYSHLREFEQTCACLHIEGMSDETLRWKLFSLSLMGRDKHWYTLTIGNNQGDWEALCSSFCLQFFSIYRVFKLCIEVLTSKQKKKESLGKAWECFSALFLILALTLPFQTLFFPNTSLWALIKNHRIPQYGFRRIIHACLH